MNGALERLFRIRRWKEVHGRIDALAAAFVLPYAFLPGTG